MGRGDKRTKKGKITRGSYGKSRPSPQSIQAQDKKDAIAAAKATA